MLTALAIVFGVGVANDANWVSFGGAGAFVPHRTIHMLGEDIDIVIFDDKIHVRVFFSFENRGPATKVEMAFPFEDTYQAQGESFLRFATKVDGVAAPVKRVTVPPITREGRNWKLQGYDLARPFAYVKTVEFSENQRRTVLVDYVTNHGYAGTGWRMNEYILHTGATWAGRIGHCSASVDWSATKEISKPALRFVTLEGKAVEHAWTMLSARKATTTLTNIEPDYDLDLTSIESFWNATLNGKPLPLHRGHAGSEGPVLSGSSNDPLIYTFGLQSFFDEGKGRDRNYFDGPVANAFGNVIKANDSRHVSDGQGRKYRLRREFVDWHEQEERAFLKDIVEALGGTFQWNAEWERIDITLPTRAKPLRVKGNPVPPSRL